MPTFQKIETVEARKYEGPKLTVVSDALGEQVANDGDYLLGTERGKVTVVSAAKFEAEYKPYSETPADDQAKADEAQAAVQKALNS